MMELTPQITARNTPASYTQITPSYTPIYHSIQIPTNNSLQNLVTNPHQPNTANDDDKTPFAETSSEKVQEATPAREQAKKRIEDHPLKSLCQKIKSVNVSKKVRKYLACSLLLFMLANLALLIYLAVYHFRKKDINLTSVAGALSYIASNLASHPILDIRVQNDHSTCPSGYHTLLLGTWPGTTAGCNCPGRLKSGVCQKSGKHASDIFCTDISPRKSIGMIFWGGSRWCVKKAKLGSQYKRAVECDTGFKKCSSGICVLDTLNCPVTKVSIQSTGTYKLETGTDRYVVPEVSLGESPVIDLDITPNDIPCFSDDYFASGPIDPYVLINQNEKGCSKYGLDKQYSFKLDKLKQKKLFDQNDFPSKVYDLPRYATIYERTDSILSYRRRLSIAEKEFCLNIDTTILENSSKAAKDLNRFVFGTLLAALIIHGILVFVISVMTYLIGAKASFSEFLKGEDSKIWILAYLFFGFMEYIDFIVMFAATAHIRGKMVGTEDYLMELAAQDCFLDAQARSAVNDYHFVVEVIAGTLFKYSLTLFSIGTFVVFSCVYLLYKKT